MIKELKEIKPGYGLGHIKFGMTRDDVKSLLGKPDEIDAHSYTDDKKELTETWYYHEFELSMTFDEEDDMRLVIISVDSKFYQFNTKIYVGLDKDSLFKKLDELGINDYLIEDCSTIESPDHHLIEIDSLSMNFWIDNGVLDEIQWSPEFIDDDTIKWPE